MNNYMTIEIDLGIATQILKDHFMQKHNLPLNEFEAKLQWKFTEKDQGKVECHHGFSTPIILMVDKLRR